MPAHSDDNSGSIEELIGVGAEITGGVLASTGAAFFAAGLAGAAAPLFAAPMIAYLFRKLGREVMHRTLGHREEVRVGATLTFAAAKIQENIAKGLLVRQDGFFQEQPSDRADAEEILEGVLLAAQREHEEKKLQFYGNLEANIAFHPEIDRAQANLLIRLTESMSYRQMCLLTLFSTEKRLDLRREDYQNFGELGEARVALLQEIYNLCIQCILDSTFGGLRVGQSIPRLEQLNPGEVSVQPTGSMLYNLMELWQVDLQDLEKLAVLLSDSKLPPPLPLGPSLSPKPHKSADTEYLNGVAGTLSEWASEADEVAYRDL